MAFVESNDGIRRILETTRTIAVVGLSDKPWRDSFSVSAFMKAQGYTIIPVNPTIETVFGIRSVPTLKDTGVKIDLVNVFRRPEFLGGIVDDALDAGAGALWLQSGIVNEAEEYRASENGLKVVSDRCIRVAYTLLMRYVIHGRE